MRQPPAKRGFVCVGVVTGVRGLRGQVTLKPFCDTAQDLAHFQDFITDADTPLTVAKFGTTKHVAWLAFNEISLRKQAEDLKGTFLYVPRKALPKLPKGAYYQADLIGQPLISQNGDEIGRVDDVYSNGVQSILGCGKQSVILLPEFCTVKKNGVHLTAAGEELFTLK